MKAPDSAVRAIVIGLVVLTFVAFSPVLNNGFIGLDDGVYITQNPQVSQGLTWEGFKWAFQAGYSGNWHPLTWLSHMVDVQLFGMNPAGHHLVNVLLHAASAVLLFILLRLGTGAVWPCAVVAALFAVHPVRVESVAWAAERKDVLSTFFLFLTLWTYIRWVRTGEGGVRRLSRGRLKLYLLCLLFFVLGLLSKPMLVSVPFILLLLDYWPLGRVEAIAHGGGLEPARWRRFGGLLVEKVPFFVLAAGSSAITLFAQRKGEAFWLELPLSVKLGNAVASYFKYLGKTFWPANLSIFYPHPDVGYPETTQWPGGALAGCAVVLAGVSAALVLPGVRRRMPWAVTGWFWYLGTLVPVIGIVQVGLQGMADRYTYVPLIGIFICVAWAGCQLARHSMRLAGGVAILGIAVCAVLTFAQTTRWRDSMTLLTHALEVTERNAVAHFQVGTEYGKAGDLEKAETHFRAALEADPNYHRAHYSLGMILEAKREYGEAMEQYRAILRVSPGSAMVRSRLAGCLAAAGRREEALAEYTEALRVDPGDAETQHKVAVLYVEVGRFEEAAEHFAMAARAQEDVPEALAGAAEELLRRGRYGEAAARFDGLVRFDPAEPVFQVGLARARLGEGRVPEAVEAFGAAIRLIPGDKRLREAVQRWLEAAGVTNSPGLPR